MPKVLKEILKLVIVIVVLVVAFIVHWALGVLAVLLVIGNFIRVNRSMLYAHRGNLAYMKGDESKALMLMEKACQMKSVTNEHQIGYGYLLLKAGKLEQAEQVFQKVLSTAKLRGDEMKVKVNLATAYWLQGKRNDGLELLEGVFKEFKNTMIYGNLGYFRILNGQLEEALELNLEAYEYNDDDKTILDNLAQNYYLLGRLEDAEEMYVKVMAKSPKYAESYYYYALTLQQLGKLEEAREQSMKAVGKELALIPSVTREEIVRLSEQLGNE